MAAMDMVVLTATTQEGFARTLIEAGAMVKSCIASPIGGNGEAIVDGQTGRMLSTDERRRMGEAEPTRAGVIFGGAHGREHHRLFTRAF